MRIFFLFFILALVMAIPFLLFSDHFDDWLLGEGGIAWLRSQGSWAWAMAVLLLVGDLVLPIPATAVMAGLGMIYGPLLGGIMGGAGSFLAGLVAYSLCRLAGRGAARRLAGERDLARGERFFARSGGWAVVLSRWLPLMPEVVACMAGLMRMPGARFFTALACGSFPMAFVYAWLGHNGAAHPLWALGFSAAAPLLLWMVVRRWMPGIEKNP